MRVVGWRIAQALLLAWLVGPLVLLAACIPLWRRRAADAAPHGRSSEVASVRCPAVPVDGATIGAVTADTGLLASA